MSSISVMALCVLSGWLPVPAHLAVVVVIVAVAVLLLLCAQAVRASRAWTARALAQSQLEEAAAVERIGRCAQHAQ